ncbi:hypothetical protein ACWC9T_40215 [Kitasatospora sp. NPDC001159]
MAYDSPTGADAVYQRFSNISTDSNSTPAAFPALGDSSSAWSEGSTATAAVRVGTTVLLVDYHPKYLIEDSDRAAVAPLARMLTIRSQQAQNGQTPTATVQQTQ